jgi:hypothetical protein
MKKNNAGPNLMNGRYYIIQEILTPTAMTWLISLLYHQPSEYHARKYHYKYNTSFSHQKVTA